MLCRVIVVFRFLGFGSKALVLRDEVLRCSI